MKSVCSLPLYVASCLAVLAGCSGGLKSSAAPDRIYVLNAAAAGGGQPVPAVLSVPRPVVSPGLDTDRIAVRRAGNELDYYAASRFGESLPKVLQALALQAMSGGDGFATTISADRAGVAMDFELLLTVRRFEAEYAAGAALPTAQVVIDCVLVAGMPRRVLGSCDGAAGEPVAEERMGVIVPALERAAQKALADVRTKAVALARAASGG
jgi:cholesterol transport system auxiliary component